MSDMNAYVWGVKGLGVLTDALTAAEDMGTPQLIVNTALVRELITKAEELWRSKNDAAMKPPGPFADHLNQLRYESRISALNSQVQGMRHDNLLAASELRQVHVANQKMQSRLDVLEIEHTRWTEHTLWGVPGVDWMVNIHGLIIPFDGQEIKARTFAASNEDAVLLISEYAAPHPAPEAEDE